MEITHIVDNGLYKDLNWTEMVTVQSVDNHVTSINTANTSSTIIHQNGIYTILYLSKQITNNIRNQVISFHDSNFPKKSSLWIIL